MGYNVPMTNQNPATPAQAATPGSVPAVVPNPSVTTPAPTGEQGTSSEGKVTIDLKEYRDLQRAKARTLSFDKRATIRGKTDHPANNPDGTQADPEIVERLNQESQARQAAERKSLQLEVRSGVRDLLEKDEFKVLPKSTKDLILKNPAMLSEAETLEEAMLDIEDFCRDQVLSLGDIGLPTPPAAQPKGHEAPPAVNAGSPAPANASGLEDVSKLHGTARSTASIRNLIKTARGVKQV
jgi:hypothetical protein